MNQQPAFPHGEDTYPNYPGLSKREFFAALILSGLMPLISGSHQHKNFARIAVEVADELIAVLEELPSGNDKTQDR